MLALVALDPIEKVVDSSSLALATIIKDSVFGALLAVAVGLLIILIRRILQVQDQRVADQKDLNVRIEASQTKYIELLEKMSEAIQNNRLAVERLDDSQDHGLTNIDKLSGEIKALQQMMDSVIRDAVRTSHVGRDDRPGAYQVQPGRTR